MFHWCYLPRNLNHWCLKIESGLMEKKKSYGTEGSQPAPRLWGRPAASSRTESVKGGPFLCPVQRGRHVQAGHDKGAQPRLHPGAHKPSNKQVRMPPRSFAGISGTFASTKASPLAMHYAELTKQNTCVLFDHKSLRHIMTIMSHFFLSYMRKNIIDL